MKSPESTHSYNSSTSHASYCTALEYQVQMSFREEPPSTLRRSYRPATEIEHDVQHHIHIFLDEQLYNSALNLLSDLITSGASCPDTQTPIAAPVPFHIELVSALLIHPRHTNQAPVNNEQKELASQAITFLRNLLPILGPLNANLAEAFSFSAPSKRGLRRSRNAEFDDGSSSSDNDDGFEKMRGVIATSGRIRSCARDFWHMVGWAFNCSVRYPTRWKYWKVWLDFMLDVLDADWNERDILDNEAGAADSLPARYLSEVRGRSAPLRRIVRSVFADGSQESMKEFPEVFQNETKEVKQKKRKREHLGDFDEGEAESASDLTDQTSHDEEDIPDPDPWLGGPESIVLRQRVLALLSKVAYTAPEAFVECKDLYDTIASSANALPLPAFTLLLSSSPSSQFPLVVYVSLVQLILTRLLPSSAPSPGACGDDDELNQGVLEACYLPFTATTASVSDNAKVSILVENLSRLLLREGMLCHTPSLESVLESGIMARESRAKGDRRKKGNNTKKDSEDLACLKASGQRLRSLLSHIQQREST